MENNNFFIVIEGIDGSGKTELSHRLALLLREQTDKKIRLTFEPHDPSCAGIFIRQVLTKKIRNVPGRTLALSFAANRLDHYVREIKPFLLEGNNRLLICDRYYLSSLVYQSDESHSIEDIMNLNDQTGKPDLTIFLNSSNSTCFKRMKRRAQDKELFEKNLDLIRAKYEQSIDFLRNRGEKVEIIDANLEINSVLNNIIGLLCDYIPELTSFQPVLSKELLPRVFSLDNHSKVSFDQLFEEVKTKSYIGPIVSLDYLESKLEDIKKIIKQRLSILTYNELGSLFLDFIKSFGFSIIEKFPWSDLDAYELEYLLPIDIRQIGVAVLLGENLRYDTITRKTHSLSKRSDFMFIFAPVLSELQSNHYDRGIMKYQDGTETLSPTTHVITQSDFFNLLYVRFINYIYQENFKSFNISKKFLTFIRNEIESNKISKYLTYFKPKKFI